MINIAGIVRKSPTNDEEEIIASINIQMEAIEKTSKQLAGDEEFDIEWFIDEDSSGDDPNRPELNRHFDNIDKFKYAVCHVPDRFSRSYLGMKWLMEYYMTDDGLSPHKGCQLHFCDVIGSLYDKNLMIEKTMFSMFGMLCVMAHAELIRIRSRTTGGRIKLKRDDPEAWKKKYKGRTPGSKNKPKCDLCGSKIGVKKRSVNGKKKNVCFICSKKLKLPM